VPGHPTGARSGKLQRTEADTFSSLQQFNDAGGVRPAHQDLQLTLFLSLCLPEHIQLLQERVVRSTSRRVINLYIPRVMEKPFFHEAQFKMTVSQTHEGKGIDARRVRLRG